VPRIVSVLTVPEVLTTVFAVDEMYFHAACGALQKAVVEQRRIDRAQKRIARLKEREEIALERHEGDVFKAYDELEPVYIQMESADYELGAAYAPFLESLALVHILAAASLEAHINAHAASLEGMLFRSFERWSLESKWLIFPRLIEPARPGFDPGAQPFQGFHRLVGFRNSLVHYQSRVEDWHAPGVPSFLGKLGLTIGEAEGSLNAVRGMVAELAKQFSLEEPFWLRRPYEPGGTSYFQVIVKTGQNRPDSQP
jgi:hypothetical protein